MTSKGPTGDWYLDAQNIKGFLLDITGVLVDSVEGARIAINGSVDAVNRLKESGIPVRFCTNETQFTSKHIKGTLCELGFNVDESEVFAPAPAVCKILQERGLRPHLLVHSEVLQEFSAVDQSNPNCVVLGDAASGFSYENLNTAFTTLINMEKPVLISMGAGRFYKHGDGLAMDVGPFMKALEYACSIEGEVVGKPEPAFFLTAVKSMGVSPEKVVMIGDDIVSDVGGAKACGLKGVQVRTGKYRPQDEPHSQVTPDGYVNNLAQAVDLYLKHK